MHKFNTAAVVLAVFGLPVSAGAFSLEKDVFQAGEPMTIRDPVENNVYSFFSPTMIKNNAPAGCVAGEEDLIASPDLRDNCGASYFKYGGNYSILENSEDCSSSGYAQCKAAASFVGEYIFSVAGEAPPPGAAVTTIKPQPQLQVQPRPPTALPPSGIITKGAAPGDRGSEIELLQKLLASDPAIYPEGLLTGYFGELTKRAVEQFQVKYGIVSGGTPEATGFGRVGPKTRAKINEVFSGIAPTDAGRDTQSKVRALQEQIRSLEERIKSLSGQ